MSEEIERFDVLLVNQARGLRMLEGMAASLVRYLFATGIAHGGEEVIARDWVELYLAPGPSAHLAFVNKAYTGPTPVFRELVLRFGSEKCIMPYGEEGVSVYFFMEFRGCAFPEPIGPFRKRLKDFMQLRVDVFARKHESLPPHREVPEDQAVDPATSGDHEGGSAAGAVGTRVEEW